MAYIPDDVEWFHAEIVLQHIVKGSSGNIVHINLVLIKATTADEAYEKAMTMGAEAESTYLNPAGKQVQTVFAGLASLGAVHDPLEDGVEILYEECSDVPEQKLKSMIKEKHELEPFCPISDRPVALDYASGEIVDELIKRLPLDAKNDLMRSMLRVVDSDDDEASDEEP